MPDKDQRTPSQAIGTNAAKDFKAYIANTPLERIPRNQFGGAAWAVIAKELHINESARSSNKEIRKALDELNMKLGAKPSVPYRDVGDEAVQKIRNENIALQNQVTALKAINRELSQDRQGERFFLATGRVLRP